MITSSRINFHVRCSHQRFGDLCCFNHQEITSQCCGWTHVKIVKASSLVVIVRTVFMKRAQNV
jgi:hypothetical protein